MIKRYLLSLLLAPVAAFAAPAGNADIATLSPTDNQEHAARLVAGLLSRSDYHYKPQPLDDALSQQIFDAFIDALDSERMFFLKSDMDRFDQYRTTFDDAIRDQQLAPAYDIFSIYLQRVAERTAYARALIAKDLDFTRKESFRFDRKDHPWEPSKLALDDAWRRRIKNDVLRLKLAGKEMPEIRKTLDKRYASFEARVRDLKSDDVFQSLMNAYAGSIEPHTAYMTPRTSENFNISMRLSLEGIGAVLQKDDEHTVIRSIVPGGPAAMSGKLEVGDRVVGVAQGEGGPFTDVIGWRIDDVVDLIRGPKGSVVRLDILPAKAGLDAPHEAVAIVRDKVKLEEQAAKSEVLEIGVGDDARRIGVITLPAFYQDFDARRRDEPDYRSATRDVRKLLDELQAQRVDGVVIDLRNNGGGSLNEAIELTGLFIEQGPVVQVRAAGGKVKIEEDRNPAVAWTGPVAVLVNRASASASEIFAAAIQDYGRGLVIGEPTFGKGTVQNLLDLDVFERGNDTPRYGQLKLTVAQFFRIDGGSTQHKGVVPDIQFPVTLDAEDYGESAYENALPWTQIRPATFASYGELDALTPMLQARHEARAAQDKEFQWWAEDVAEYRKQRERTTLSLVEAERRAERDAEEARRAARKAEREAAGLADISDARTDDGLLASERELEEDLARQEAEKERPDVLLREAAAILADAIGLLDGDKALAARVFPDRQASVSGSN